MKTEFSLRQQLIQLYHFLLPFPRLPPPPFFAVLQKPARQSPKAKRVKVLDANGISRPGPNGNRAVALSLKMQPTPLKMHQMSLLLGAGSSTKRESANGKAATGQRQAKVSSPATILHQDQAQPQRWTQRLQQHQRHLQSGTPSLGAAVPVASKQTCLARKRTLPYLRRTPMQCARTNARTTAAALLMK